MSEQFFDHMFYGALLVVALVVGIVAWAVVRVRLNRRAARRLGLGTVTGDRWRARVAVRTEGAGYRAAEEEIVVGAEGAAPRRIALTSIRRARWVRDPQRHFGSRLEDALHLSLDGETVTVPGSADGIADVLSLLERHRILEEVNVVLK